MTGHKICFNEEIWLLPLNYPFYPFLSGALHKAFQTCCLLLSSSFSSASPSFCHSSSSLIISSVNITSDGAFVVTVNGESDEVLEDSGTNQGPVVQSMVSLTSSLGGQLVMVSVLPLYKQIH